MSSSDDKLGASFCWFNTTQFLGALNDNIFKLLVIMYLIGMRGRDSAGAVASTVGVVFVIPFLLFSALAGKWADRFSKRDIIVGAKVAELVVMLAGVAMFLSGSMRVLYAVLFLMATQSAFFGPAKYGIILELVGREQLSRANSFIQGLTYLAIVLGTGISPLLVQVTGGRFAMVGLVCVLVSVAGLAVSILIKRTEPAGSKARASVLFFRDIWRTLADIRGKENLLPAVIASAYFLLIGAFIYINMIAYGIERLGFDQMQSGYLFLAAAIGIGAGAYSAGKLSGRHIEFGVVPLGAAALTLASFGLGLTGGGLRVVLVLLFMTGFGAGLFIVPVHAYIQYRSEGHKRGQVLAASGFLGWIGVFLASALVYVFTALLSVSAGQLFVLLGVMTAGLTIGTLILLPDFLVRFIGFVLVRIFYRIRVKGAENVPVDGPVLLVCNHVSWVDVVLLMATQTRRIRFVMDKGFYNTWWLRPLCRLMGVIPISGNDPPKKILASLRQARAAMDDGFIVCIFAEGAMTRTGMVRAFKRGFERIVRGRAGYKIVPVYIGGVWGSIFSYYYGRPLSTLPRRFPYPVAVYFGRAMSSQASTQQIRQKVTELSSEYFEDLKSGRRSLGEHFIRTARRNWRRRCVSDSTGRKLTYGQTLAAATALAEQIANRTAGQQKVGILLPPSAGAVLVNVATALLGKVSVNLNYAVGKEILNSAVKQCHLKTIISSASFARRFDYISTLDGVVFLEDIAAKIGTAAKVKAYLKARLSPARILANSSRFDADDLMTVIFSSGSSGEPKGVMLSHHNILSNIEAVRAVFRLRDDDDLCAVLPFFHSLGYTCSLWLPIVSGVSASYSANPLDARAVGEVARENRSTIFFATPTFLLNYIRRISREDFASLREVIVGAEKLGATIAESFEEKFALRPLEGYGATELSPVVSLNLPEVESGGVYQVGNKTGTVGHPIPGVAVKTVDPEDGRDMRVGEEGLLMVKGPNVMLGYLENERQTNNVIKDGWYDTQDMGRIDEDGFLLLTGRLSRFSKIGGEMVPHLRLEEVFHRALGTDEQLVAVTSVPHHQKAEELVVLYVDKAGDVGKLHEIIKNSELPNIWKPRRDNYIRIESMPVLGSGKLDIVRLRQIALAAKADPTREIPGP